MKINPNPLSPSTGRYELPNTPYFAKMRNTMPLAKLAGYARARRRADLVGDNFEHRVRIPVSWPHEYSPFGAGLVEEMRQHPDTADVLTGRWDRAAVVSPSTAILGLGSAAEGSDGSLQAISAWPIMVGKAKIFGYTAGVDTTPHTPDIFLVRDQLRALESMTGRQRSEQMRIWRAERFAEYVRAIAPMYGFINIEDAQGADLPIIFGALECLKGQCAIWSDDKQGTGVITAAAVLAWAEDTGRNKAMQDIRVVIFGAGAGGAGVYDELLHHGLKPQNILVTDSGPKTDGRPKAEWEGQPFALHEGRDDVDSDVSKVKMRESIPEGTTVEQFVQQGVDIMINLGTIKTLTANKAWTEWLTRALNPNALFLPMTNPEPGITSDMLRDVRADAYYGSGNQVDHNPVNNFTAFGYIGLGALIAMAGGVGPGMTVAAARGILKVAKMDSQFGRLHLVPDPRDIRLIEHEAGEVAMAAARERLSLRLGPHPTGAELAAFDAAVMARIRFQRTMVEEMRESAKRHGAFYLQTRYPSHFAPFYLRGGQPEEIPAYHVAPQIDREKFEFYAREMGIKVERWADLLEDQDHGQLKPKALTLVLERLRPATEGDSERTRQAFKELEIIVQIASISPALGLALALRRTRVREENRVQRPTVFHRQAVLRVVLAEVPEAGPTIYGAFSNIPQGTNGSEPV